jgi:molybdate transport system ATP-binding protein
MDEPLASLDTPRKAEIMPFLTRLKTSLKLPVLYVTHALEEVAELADSLVLVDAGSVLAYGPVSEVAARADLPIGQRDDAGAVVGCAVVAHDTARVLTLLRGAGAGFWVPLMDTPVGGACRIRIPAREVILASEPPHGISLHNIIRGTVRRTAAEAGRRSVMVEIALPEGGLLARVTPDAVARLALLPGAPVLGLIKSTSIEVLGR